MQLYLGAHLIECEFGGRPLYLPLLIGEDEAVLVDCGAKTHAAKDIPAYCEKIGLPREKLTWLIITHPDVDHCGGAAEMARRYPNLRIACGAEDRTLVESPDFLYTFRYDHYREEHNISYDETTATGIRQNGSGPCHVSLTFTGEESLRLGPDRLLEVIHLPGHSHGHLGLYDSKYRALFYGDAIQGAGYRSLSGGWALCPTYLYVEPYLQTIQRIETLGAELLVGCHWPVCRGAGEIREFLAASRNFVETTDRLIHNDLTQRPSGATLAELCETLGSKLGDWPAAVNREFCYAFHGHLDRGISQGTLIADRSVRPVVYRHAQTSV